MRKIMKISLAIAAALVLAGCAVFGGVMTVLGWDFTKLSTVRYETNVQDIYTEFRNISLETDVADIQILPSGDGKVKVECFEEAKAKHSVLVEGDTLAIRENDERAWYDFIGINSGTSKITVYLPENVKLEDVDISVSVGVVNYSVPASGDVKIRTSTGRIQVGDASVGSLGLIASTGAVEVTNVTCTGDVDLKVTTGKTLLTNLECKNLISSGSTGNMILDHVLAKENFSIRRTTGDVKFEACDAAEIDVKTSTGKVTGSLLTDKVFMAETSTGKISVPRTMTGGRCQISTSTGNIKITTG